MNVNLFAHFGLGLHGREILPDQVEEPHVQPIAPPAEPAAVEPPEPLPMASGNFYLPVKTCKNAARSSPARGQQKLKK